MPICIHICIGYKYSICMSVVVFVSVFAFFCISALVSVSVFELVTVAYNQDDVGVEVPRERHAGDAYLYL